MTARREGPQNHRSGRPARHWGWLVTGTGWVLLAYLPLRVAQLGGVAADVRAFQIAYVVAFVGYGLLVWRMVRRSLGESKPTPSLESRTGRTSAAARDSATGADRPPNLPPTAARGRSWRWWLLGCLALRLITVGVEPTDDAYRYVWEGRIQRAGFNPYAHRPADPALAALRTDQWEKINHPDYPAIYPPLAQAEFLLAAVIHPSLRTVKLFHLLWDSLTVIVLAACLRQRGRPPQRAMVYALCPLVLSAFAIEGHMDALMVLLMCTTLWAVGAGRMALGGVFLGLAMSVKLIPVVLLPWFVLRHRRAALLAVAVLAASYLPYAGAGGALFESLHRFAGSGEFFSFAGALGITRFDSKTARFVAAGLLGIGALVLARRESEYVRYAAGATGLFLLLMPIVHYWYISWILLYLPFLVRIPWLAAALAGVVYFQAAGHYATWGAWVMPPWAAPAVWRLFLGVWLVDLLVRLVRRGSAGRRRDLGDQVDREPPACL